MFMKLTLNRKGLPTDMRETKPYSLVDPDGGCHVELSLNLKTMPMVLGEYLGMTATGISTVDREVLICAMMRKESTESR